MARRRGMLIRLFLLCAIVASLTAAGGVTANAATHARIGDRLTRDVSKPKPPVKVKPPSPKPPVKVRSPAPKPQVKVKSPAPKPPVKVKPATPKAPDPEPPVTVKPPDPEPPVTVEPPTPEPPDPEPPVAVAPEAPPAPSTAHVAAAPQAASHVAQPSAPRSRRAASVSSATGRAANSRARSRSSASSGPSTPATRIGNRARRHRDVRRATIAHGLHGAGGSMRRSWRESPVAVDRRRPATAMTAVPVAVTGARLPAQNVTMPRLGTSDRGNGIPLWSVIGFTLLVIGLRTFRPTIR